ncbi:MAG TPA: methyl-accepting chemotaxis protein [Fimbriimonadaceae bacterium]|nr:methyl-accepting chemotaxis protein [Fimbriimonadaceae bacterium]
MSVPNRRRFKSHLVNHELRLRLVIDDMLFALVAALAAIGILYWLSNREIGDSLWSAHLSIKETKELLDNGIKVAGLVTFVAVLIFGFWSMLDAHRIAGPAHRLKLLLDDIAAGNLTHEIQFRKRDEFQELAASADALVESYQFRVQRLQTLAGSIEAAAGGDPELAKLAAELKAELADFKLPEAGA